jgi:hypothetical protein
MSNSYRSPACVALWYPQGPSHEPGDRTDRRACGWKWSAREEGQLAAGVHQGKYDANDTFDLVAFDGKRGSTGDWEPPTPVADVSGT